jgi:hypothetical protein
MITIARFSKPEEAHLLRLRLEAGGVPAYIQDENMIQMDWLYSNAIGGVRVQISEEDIAHAQEILQEPLFEDISLDLPTCPSCSSRRTAPDELPRRISFLSILLLSFPLPLKASKTKWRCLDCNHTWKLPNKTEQGAAANP